MTGLKEDVMAVGMEKSGWIRETQEVESAWLITQLKLNERWEW